MSTLAYAQLTEKREAAIPGTSTDKGSPGVRTWIDALAALVPAEVLAVHAALVATMTKAVPGASGEPVTIITNVHTLSIVFYALVALSVLLYASARLVARKWDRLDYVRMLIPAFAFVGWTMLQRTTAFDAAWPNTSLDARTAIAVIGAVLLGVLASVLAYKADQKV
jgi:hypothetical protein